jgi:hypothetical protein
VTADISLSGDGEVNVEVVSPETRIKAAADTAYISALSAYMNG